MKYLALLRGVNVGGKSLLRMSELKEALEAAGLAEVRTFIQSGNVLFAGPRRATTGLARQIEATIEKRFAMRVEVTVFTAAEWEAVVQRAPKWWGKSAEWKHNLLALLPETTPQDVIAAMGALKPEIERVAVGPRVVYQSMSRDLFGRTSSGKLPSHPIYRRITVRNFNTTQKLAKLLAN